MTSPTLTATALPGIPLIETGADLVAIMLAACERAGLTVEVGDVLVVTSKIVSKAEGRLVDLKTISPGETAQKLAAETNKDPRIVELVLRESKSISRTAPNVLVVEHRLGFVSASAGIDHSNARGDEDFVLLLPVDPDGTAQTMRDRIKAETGVDVGIVISDSHGRPFRLGNVGVAIGVAGLPALLDVRGDHDLFGRELEISIQGYADMIASAANLLAGEGSQGLPVVLVRGLTHAPQHGRASDIYRDPAFDLYR